MSDESEYYQLLEKIRQTESLLQTYVDMRNDYILDPEGIKYRLADRSVTIWQSRLDDLNAQALILLGE